jgi:hypothetical protein
MTKGDLAFEISDEIRAQIVRESNHNLVAVHRGQEDIPRIPQALRRNVIPAYITLPRHVKAQVSLNQFLRSAEPTISQPVGFILDRELSVMAASEWSAASLFNRLSDKTEFRLPVTLTLPGRRFDSRRSARKFGRDVAILDHALFPHAEPSRYSVCPVSETGETEHSLLIDR